MELNMPYISQEKRREVVEHGPQTAGDLNFALTVIISDYAAQAADRCGGLSYQILNDVIGALESAKAEFQRRIVAPYEDSKIATNGDVYV